MQVQVPASGSETIECSVCQHPFLVSAHWYETLDDAAAAEEAYYYTNHRWDNILFVNMCTEEWLELCNQWNIVVNDNIS